MTIQESGIIFGDYDENDVYPIEKSKKYSEIKSKGVSSVEFVLHWKNKKILFVEAKNSAPNPNNPDNEQRFEEFLQEINIKFEDSFEIFERVWLEREIGGIFDRIEVQSCEIIFLLVINGFNKEWLVPIKEGLEQILKEHRTLCLLWHPKVLVINEQQAASKGLVISE